MAKGSSVPGVRTPLPPAFCRFHVVDAKTGVPVSPILVRIFSYKRSAHGLGEKMFFKTWFRGGGVKQFPLPKGSLGDWVLEFRARGFRNAQGLLASFLRGEKQPLRIEMDPGRQLVGKVVDLKGRPVGGARVGVKPGSWSWTDPEGRYGVDVWEGSWGYQNRSHRVSLLAERAGVGAMRFEARGDALFKAGVPTLVLGAGQRLSGRVVDGEGKPLGKRILLGVERKEKVQLPLVGFCSKEQWTDAQGFFAFEGLAKGHYELRATFKRPGMIRDPWAYAIILDPGREAGGPPGEWRLRKIQVEVEVPPLPEPKGEEDDFEQPSLVLELPEGFLADGRSTARDLSPPRAQKEFLLPLGASGMLKAWGGEGTFVARRFRVLPGKGPQHLVLRIPPVREWVSLPVKVEGLKEGTYELWASIQLESKWFSLRVEERGFGTYTVLLPPGKQRLDLNLRGPLPEDERVCRLGRRFQEPLRQPFPEWTQFEMRLQFSRKKIATLHWRPKPLSRVAFLFEKASGENALLKGPLEIWVYRLDPMDPTGTRILDSTHMPRNNWKLHSIDGVLIYPKSLSPGFHRFRVVVKGYAPKVLEAVLKPLEDRMFKVQLRRKR